MIPTILVIFGASGDLAKRYLLPAIFELERKGALPSQFHLIEASRSDYGTLKGRIIEIEGKIGGKTQKLLHLAVPSKACKEVVDFIGTSGLVDEDTILLLEKPFGNDVKTATELIEHIDKYFQEKQVYRVDHYLVRDTSQEILNRRIREPALEEKWNNNFIESIQIIASEKIDIEGRVNFYEHTGALRDFVQSHLLEIAALVLMKLPKVDEDESAIQDHRYEALKNLSVVCDISHHECVKRAQYEGYREEVSNSASITETYVSINLASSDPVWHGVPINLTTGKAFKEKFTVAKIKFKNGEELIFNLAHQDGKSVNGYEQVFKCAINRKSHLFTSSKEVLESWRILELIQSTWQKGAPDLLFYLKGTDISSL